MEARSGSRPRALITGASSGIGQAFAEHLAYKGYDLVVLARRRHRLEELATRLHGEHGVTVETLVADLTDADVLRAVEHRVREDETLQLLINNAGFAGCMPLVQQDPAEAEDLVRIHVLATTRLTRAALPSMISQRTGAIINVASLLAYSASVPNPTPLPGRAVYAACKAYIITFTEGLHHELEGTGVQVQALCPGPTRGTEFYGSISGVDESRFQIGASEIVMASLVGLRLGEVICIPGLDAPELIAETQASERQILQRASPGIVAERYTA